MSTVPLTNYFALETKFFSKIGQAKQKVLFYEKFCAFHLFENQSFLTFFKENVEIRETNI